MSTDLADPRLLTTHELRLVSAGQQTLDMSLDRIVVTVANFMQTDVGSLYLYEEDEDSLVLMATVGLLQSCVGKLRMRPSEGLVGLVAETLEPVVLARAPEHPRFKYFPEADEDEYQSFLGVPIMHGELICGVLVVQTIEPREFSADEIAQLAGVAKLLGPSLNDHSI